MRSVFKLTDPNEDSTECEDKEDIRKALGNLRKASEATGDKKTKASLSVEYHANETTPQTNIILQYNGDSWDMFDATMKEQNSNGVRIRRMNAISMAKALQLWIFLFDDRLEDLDRMRWQNDGAND